MNKEKLTELAKAVIDNEAEAVAALKQRIDASFLKACQLLLECSGRIVVMGMGKSGHIGGKIAATLASTGSPAFFVHPGEASHGDMGMITPSDVVMVFSNSGETDEILTLLPLIKRLNVPLVAFTGNPNSTLAKNASAHIDVSIEKEACPLGLAPTTSTTTALAMGDALAISILEERGFTADDFAMSHPGGQLGRRLLLRISDIMHTGEQIPIVNAKASLSDALVEMTQKGLGMTTVVDDNSAVLGIFTDGDLRRLLDHGEVNIHSMGISDVMIKNCKTGNADSLASEGLHIMQKHKISALPITDDNNKLVGALNMHDLLRAGVV
ncbi:KpsF/GutQ family sugar-phosphate isomerase [Kaarinaea lacus]